MVQADADAVAGETPPRTDGRATRWDDHRTARRLELVRAARRCVRQRGPDVSMDEIASDIGTSKSILYRYFTDKAGLQRAVGQLVLDRMLHELTEAATKVGGPRERIRAMVDVYLQMADDAPHVYSFVTSPAGEAAAGEVRGFVHEVQHVVAQTLVPTVLGLDDDTAVDDITAEQAARAALWAAGVVGTVRSAVERWMTARAEAPVVGERPVPGGEAPVVGQRLAPDGEAPVVGQRPVPDVEALLAGADRDEVAALISSWLWDGAVGVARRARTETQPRTVQTARPTDKDAQ